MASGIEVEASAMAETEVIFKKCMTNGRADEWAGGQMEGKDLLIIFDCRKE